MSNDNRYYDYKKLQYEADLVRYRSDLQAWNALPDDKKRALSREAEDRRLGMWSLGVAAGASYFLYHYVEHTLKGDTFWEVWGGATLVFAVVALILRKIIGKAARGIVIASLIAVICSALISVGADHLHKPMSSTLSRIIFWALFAFGVLCEYGGAFHASAAPGRPTPPTKPPSYG